MLCKLQFLLLLLIPLFSLGQNKKKVKATHSGSAIYTPEYDYKIVGADMPGLRLVTNSGKVVTNADIGRQNNIIIMLFNPTCDHCEKQAMKFRDSLQYIPQSRLYLMATHTMGEYLDDFINKTKLETQPGILVGVDSAQFIDRAFIYKSLPQVNIYNKAHKLVHIFNGIVPIDSIKAYIK